LGTGTLITNKANEGQISSNANDTTKGLLSIDKIRFFLHCRLSSKLVLRVFSKEAAASWMICLHVSRFEDNEPLMGRKAVILYPGGGDVSSPARRVFSRLYGSNAGTNVREVAEGGDGGFALAGLYLICFLSLVLNY
ncbi:hypothetical protein LOAG_15859, partial [Loa loa]